MNAADEKINFDFLVVGKLDMYEDLISVIVPVYGVEKYLQKCIDSICGQTYRNLQIVLVDDGSPDDCGAICENAKKLDKRVTVIHKQNGGVSDARNFGIDVAKGKYITFIDGDDYISSDFIEYLYRLIKTNNAEISIAGFVKTKKRDDKSRINNPSTECFSQREALREMLYARKFSMSPWGKLYLTEFYSNIRYPYGKIAGEDILTTYKVFNKACKIIYGNQICYYYLRRSGSILNSSSSKKIFDMIDGLEQLKRELPMKKYRLDKAYASQMIECIASILEHKPNLRELKEWGVWEKFKKNRRVVLSDSDASKRVRAYALLSYLGLPVLSQIISSYYIYKWSKNE